MTGTVIFREGASFSGRVRYNSVPRKISSATEK